MKTKLTNFLSRILSSSLINCAQSKDHTDLPPPMDEEIVYDDMGPYTKFPSKPPQFDQLTATIQSITKRQENIKGMRFELPYSFSPNFHISTSWQLLHSQKKQESPQDQYMQSMNAMGGQEKSSLFTLVAQYIKGALTMEQPLPELILTSRLMNNGYQETALIKRFATNIIAKITAQFPNSNIEMGQIGAEFEQESKFLGLIIGCSKQIQTYIQIFQWDSLVQCDAKNRQICCCGL